MSEKFPAQETVKATDLTLRDGQQAAGFGMTSKEKIETAGNLHQLGVDGVEAGFPASSPEDRKAVAQISQEFKETKFEITALARAHTKDIEHAGEALKDALAGRIAIVIPSSHIDLRLGMKIEQAEDHLYKCVQEARKYTKDVLVYLEDAPGAKESDLRRLSIAAVEAGITTLSLPDTRGSATPAEYEALFRMVRKAIVAEDVVLAAHTHNDIGLALANALAAVEGGAREVHGTLGGIGERAGNASIEQLVMQSRVKDTGYTIGENIKPQLIGSTVRSFFELLDIPLPPNLPYVGSNAFSHGAGIHSEAVARKDPSIYEIVPPDQIGWEGEKYPLTVSVGRAALAKRVTRLGYDEKAVNDNLGEIYRTFIELADQGEKRVYEDEDLQPILDRLGITPSS